MKSFIYYLTLCTMLVGLSTQGFANSHDGETCGSKGDRIDEPSNRALRADGMDLKKHKSMTDSMSENTCAYFYKTEKLSLDRTVPLEFTVQFTKGDAGDFGLEVWYPHGDWSEMSLETSNYDHSQKSNSLNIKIENPQWEWYHLRLYRKSEKNGETVEYKVQLKGKKKVDNDMPVYERPLPPPNYVPPSDSYPIDDGNRYSGGIGS